VKICGSLIDNTRSKRLMKVRKSELVKGLYPEGKIVIKRSGYEFGMSYSKFKFDIWKRDATMFNRKGSNFKTRVYFGIVPNEIIYGRLKGS